MVRDNAFGLHERLKKYASKDILFNKSGIFLCMSLNLFFIQTV